MNVTKSTWRNGSGNFLLLLALIPLIAAYLTPTASAGAATRSAQPQIQALVALQRLDSDFYDARKGLYVVTGDKYGPSASLWPTSQVLNAAIDVARLTHAPSELTRIRRIIGSLPLYLGRAGVYHTRIFPSRRYTDDNNWIALDLLDAYNLLHDPTYLTQAERIFSYLVASWDPNGGGLIWGDEHAERPTVSTAPAITIGLRLAAITHNTYYSDWAQRFYAWENSHLRAPGGAYWDHLQANGAIDRTWYTYNQGVMIDANLAYAAQSGKARYVDEARRIATAAAVVFPQPWRRHGHYAAFDAIYTQALARLNLARPGSAGLAAAQDYVRWEWPPAMAPRAVRDQEALLEQAAFVIAAASLAGGA